MFANKITSSCWIILKWIFFLTFGVYIFMHTVDYIQLKLLLIKLFIMCNIILVSHNIICNKFEYLTFMLYITLFIITFKKNSNNIIEIPTIVHRF